MEHGEIWCSWKHSVLLYGIMVRVSRSQLYVFSDLRNEFRSSCSEIIHDQRCICEGFAHALSYGNPETCGEHHHPQDPQVDQLGTREPCLPDSLFVVSSKCANLSGWYLPRAPTQLSMQRQEPRATPSASTVGPSPTQHHKNWSCQKYKHTFSTSLICTDWICLMHANYRCTWCTSMRRRTACTNCGRLVWPGIWATPNKKI